MKSSQSLNRIAITNQKESRRTTRRGKATMFSSYRVCAYSTLAALIAGGLLTTMSAGITSAAMYSNHPIPCVNSIVLDGHCPGPRVTVSANMH